MRIIHYIYIFTLVVMGVMVSGCSGMESYRSVEGGVWNTTYHVTYRAGRDMQDSILLVMREVERSLSPFDGQSLVSAVNRGDSVKADSLLRRIFTASQEVNLRSGGAFDPTVAPLVNLWGYGYRSAGVEPTQVAIDSLLAFVGIDECSMTSDGYIRKKHAGTEFNFSAITKGYGCDLVGDMLRRNGCEDYMVEIGGEIALSGRSPRGGDWRVMIDAPVDCDTAVVHERMAVVAVTGCGVATSGNYRNYHETKNGRTWHTISTVDGRPAVTDLLSATVIAPSCMIADAYATACMVLTARQACRMIESLPDVEGLLVTADSVITTSGFPEILR
ncbi:FAD:protein FMN transferase [uncultured Duncaniella sp.]|uniref:FAD:protein FMN transferase n=1 Tax=uncultured Duncaniella sp. TaxID=2768039 RepID=UPI00272BBF39|nr:FAD:protein FMN transferase [uncultured Duncaniella sp.]